MQHYGNQNVAFSSFSNQTAPVGKKNILHKYGLNWPKCANELEIELQMIQAGGYVQVGGRQWGEGLFHHFRAAQTLCWPDDDHHRWSDLMLRTITEERITVVQGARDTGKTHTSSKFGLIDYWSSPEDTLTIVSSTGMRELELRVWGNIKDLFQRATARWPDTLAGRVSNAYFGIFTDLLEETADIRDMRRGIICVPCLGGDGEWIGMERYVGIKQKRRRLLGDEMQFMHVMYVNVLDAMDKGDFKGVFVGNPIGGNGKALDKIAEPRGGWSSLGEVTKTRSWKNKYGGVTINLVGTDSPNFDKDAPKKYPYLIDQGDLDRVLARNGRDSSQYWTLIMGVRKTGVDNYRVLTAEICERYKAHNTATWATGERQKIYAIDAGFGGDPCEVVYLEVGEDVSGRQVVEFSETRQVPILISEDQTPEDQIAYFVKQDCARLEVPDNAIFFDAGMRATLAISLARIISAQVNAVNFGGPATDRPVSDDMFTIDPKTKERRPVKCVEHYSKFVTELWYSVRELVEAEQCRGMPKSAVDEFALREWRWVPGPIGPRYELETKPDFKARNTFSPNKADVISLGLEGARRLGFTISNPRAKKVAAQDASWLEREVSLHRKFVRSHELTYK